MLSIDQPWHVGDVAGIVAEIRADYQEFEAPHPFGIRMTPGRHARMQGYSVIRALALNPERSGKSSAADTIKLIKAVLEAVQIIIDESMAELDARISARALALEATDR